jgi:transposase InsO family protein
LFGATDAQASCEVGCGQCAPKPFHRNRGQAAPVGRRRSHLAEHETVLTQGRGACRTGPWKTIEDVELATLSWVHWHNASRLHGYLNDVPLAEFDARPT